MKKKTTLQTGRSCFSTFTSIPLTSIPLSLQMINYLLHLLGLPNSWQGGRLRQIHKDDQDQSQIVVSIQRG